MTPSTQFAISTEPRTPRPWWLELILVDFRHARWLWLAYLVACALFTQMPNLDDQLWGPREWIWVNIIILFSVPAIVSAIFTADFNHATAETLQALPVRRSHVWLTRMVLLLVLVFLPLLLAILMFSIFARDPLHSFSGSEITVMYSYAVALVQGLWCYVTIGPLIAVLLRKGLPTWSAIVVSPFFIFLFALIIQHVIGYDDPETFDHSFPYLPPFLFWFVIITGVPAAVLAFYQWQRLEVRS